MPRQTSGVRRRLVLRHGVVDEVVDGWRVDGVLHEAPSDDTRGRRGSWQRALQRDQQQDVAQHPHQQARCQSPTRTLAGRAERA